MGSAASCFILTSLNYLQVIFFSPYKTSGYYNTCKSKNTNRKKRVLLISCFYNFIFVLFWFCIRVRIRFRFWTRYWVWNFRRVFFHCNNKCLCLLCISNCNSITSCFLRIESTAINCCCLCHIRCFSAFKHRCYFHSCQIKFFSNLIFCLIWKCNLYPGQNILFFSNASIAFRRFSAA